MGASLPPAPGTLSYREAMTLRSQRGPASGGAASAPPGRPENRTDRLAAVFDHIWHYVAVLDAAGHILDLNRSALEQLKRPWEDLVGRPIREFAATSADGTALANAVARAAGGERSRFRLGRAGAVGTAGEVEMVMTPIRDAAGAVTVIVAEAWDIGDTLSAQVELSRSQQKFAGIVSISADAIISVDDAFRITDFNRGAERIFGWSAYEILGQPLDVLIPERWREAHRGHVRRFGEGRDVARRMGERREIRGVRRSGEEFPADASISKLEVGGRRIYTVVLRDITGQRRSEAVQRFLAHAGTLLASSLDVATTYESIARLAADFIADCCVFFEVTGNGIVRRAAAAVGETGSDNLVSSFRGQVLEQGSPHPVQQVLREGLPLLLTDVPATLQEIDHGEDDLRLFRELPVQSAMILPLLARGRTAGAIGLYRTPAAQRFTADDLAHAEELAVGCALAVDNARLYESAQEAVRARDDVLAVVSHDLGNPLSAIRIGVSLLLRGAPGGRLEGAWQHLAGIQQSVEQMERLIRDLLEVKRIEAGHLSLDLRPVRPATLVAGALEMLAPIAEGKAIRMKAHVRSAVPLVFADSERVIQALSNLVGNAVKFTPSGGRVDVRAESRKHEVVFTVADTGPGIDADDLDHIFDRFWQARRNRGSGRGLGLGLAIVKGIVQAHGGRVWATSEPGVGTTVRFTLPIAADSSTQTA